MATIYILTTTTTNGAKIRKLGHYISTNQANIALKATELQISQYQTETYQAETYVKDSITFYQVYGVLDAVNNQVFEGGFLISDTTDPVTILSQQAKEYAQALNMQIIVDKRAVPVIKLKDEITTHPFVTTSFQEWSNEFYNYGETGYKALLPVPFIALDTYIQGLKTQEEMNALISEMSLYAYQVSILIEEFKLKQLTESPELTEVEFLDDPVNQALIASKVNLSPADFPILNSIPL